jgi:hypothetical protein
MRYYMLDQRMLYIHLGAQFQCILPVVGSFVLHLAVCNCYQACYHEWCEVKVSSRRIATEIQKKKKKRHAHWLD